MWPDFPDIPSLWPFLRVFSIFQNFEPTLATLLYDCTNFHWCQLSIVENIFGPSCHTEFELHIFTLFLIPNALYTTLIQFEWQIGNYTFWYLPKLGDWRLLVGKVTRIGVKYNPNKTVKEILILEYKLGRGNYSNVIKRHRGRQTLLSSFKRLQRRLNDDGVNVDVVNVDTSNDLTYKNGWIVSKLFFVLFVCKFWIL